MRCLLLLLTAGFLLAACAETPDYGTPIDRDWAQIVERDTLVAIMSTNSTGYFLYRGEPRGFEYELLRAFTDEHDIVLRTRVVQERDELFRALNRGEGDVVAARLLPMEVDTPYVAFTYPLYRTEPVVVQRSDTIDDTRIPDEVEEIIEAVPDTLVPAATDDSIEIRARLITRPEQLAGETVHLTRGSYTNRLLELSDSVDGDIHVVEVEDDVNDEALIAGLARGDVELMVSQGNLARLSQGQYENIFVRPAVGQPHAVSWAVRRNAPDLLDAFNEWLQSNSGSELFNSLYQRYFIDRTNYVLRMSDEYLTSETGRLSEYDDLLYEAASEIGWDWRLLAAQAYQESRFEPRARSWAGAQGLLQLMPATAAEFGVSNVDDPRDNVGGAVRFIQWLTDYWSERIGDDDERLKFILASYNTGHGHVEDARRLTDKNGGPDDVWEEVAVWLLQKSNRLVYEDPVVRYGYSRGLEPVLYVAKILNRYDHYREFVTEEPISGEDPVHRPVTAVIQ